MNKLFSSALFMGLILFSFTTMSAQTIDKDEINNKGVRTVQVTPEKAVCSTKIEIEIIRDSIINQVVFTNGCDGNAKGLNALIKGMSMDEAISRLEGILCGKKSTSCPDQLAKALKTIKETRPKK